MSQYTTGDIARICGVSVRTVQYYDTRGLLRPSALSEGGRRLYSEEDLKLLKVICFLRDLDIPINTIAQLLDDEQPEDIIDIFLQQQKEVLSREVSERQARLEKLTQLQRGLKGVDSFSLESIGDIALMLENKKKLRRVHLVMLAVGIPLEIIEWSTFFLALNSGNWLPYLTGLAVLILGSVWISWYYFSTVAYICPKCHRVFKPAFKTMFWAKHTPTTRKLPCPHCGRTGFCVEICQKESK